MEQQCAAALSIKGVGFRCDQKRGHQGWAHSNREAGALWEDGLAAAAAPLDEMAAALLTSGDVAGWGHFTEAARIVRGDRG